MRLSVDTVSNHLRALVKTKQASVFGSGRTTRYLGIADHGEQPSSVNGHPRSDLFGSEGVNRG